jgi:hypothetical protein
MQTLESLVSKRSSFEIGNAIEKLERYKPLGTNQIPTDLIQRGNALRSEFNTFV